MKKIKLSIMILLLAGAVACKKTDNPSQKITANVSGADAADLVAGSLSVNSNGFASISDDVAVQSKVYIDTHLACGSTKIDTITKKSGAGASVSYSYGLGYSYTLNCNSNNIPDNITGKVNYSGNFSGPHISSANTGNLIFRLAGLTPTAIAYVFNGTFLRNGSFASKIDTTNHGNSNLTIEVKDLKFRKPARTIASGTATFSLNGSVPKKGDFSFTGTLVFNGDGTAKLTINGTIYTLDLTTGEKTKV
jgi:hypothetical protein